MPKTKGQKANILKNLEDKIARMKAAVMFNFSGIKVKDINKLRDNCREAGLDYLVVKKTLFNKVLSEKGLIDDANRNFDGEIAALFSYEDEVAPARVLAAFAKENEKIKFSSGFFQGSLVDAAKVIELSKIPSRQELLAKVVGCLSNPLSGLVRVLQAVKESKEKTAV